MHDHSSSGNKDGGHKRMMWMMIPCLLLLGILFLGGDKLSSSEYLWPILIGAFVVAHVWMMFKGHRWHRGDDMENESNAVLGKQHDPKNGHKHGGSYH